VIYFFQHTLPEDTSSVLLHPLHHRLQTLVLYGLGCSSFLAIDADNTDMTICVQAGEITILEIPQILSSLSSVRTSTTGCLTDQNGMDCLKPFHFLIKYLPVWTGTSRNFCLNLWHFL